MNNKVLLLLLTNLQSMNHDVTRMNELEKVVVWMCVLRHGGTFDLKIRPGKRRGSSEKFGFAKKKIIKLSSHGVSI